MTDQFDFADKVADRDQLIALNDAAIQTGYNRTLDPDQLDRLLDSDGYNLLHPLLIHEHKAGMLTDPHYRCRVIIKKHGSKIPDIAFLDVSMPDFNALRSVESMFEEKFNNAGQ